MNCMYLVVTFNNSLLLLLHVSSRRLGIFNLCIFPKKFPWTILGHIDDLSYHIIYVILTFLWYIAIQSVDWNHLWFLISFTPFFKFPNLFVKSTCSNDLRRSFKSELKWDGKRTWNIQTIYNCNTIDLSQFHQIV